MNPKNYVDPRDGKVYPCRQMPDGKWWFTKNLAYAGTGEDYNNVNTNRLIYGRLYTFSQAATACPQGCHIPSNAEWTALVTAIGGADLGGTKLKANSSLWSVNTGIDSYGFSALPAGGDEGGGDFHDLGTATKFWSSTADGSYAYLRGLNGGLAEIWRESQQQFRMISVRCIVDTFYDQIIYTDPRDGTEYPCVKMPDGKLWFTKNLAYAGKGMDYNNDPANRATYGRLYTWDDAFAACPVGCHIPTDAEWTALTTAAGGSGSGTTSTVKIEAFAQNGTPPNPMMNAALRLYNNSGSAIDLTSYRIRFWFFDSEDLAKLQSHVWWYSAGSTSQVAIAFGGDSVQKYIDITFTAGSVATGSFGEVQFGLNNADWVAIDNALAYSTCSSSGYAENNRIAVYHSDALIYGIPYPGDSVNYAGTNLRAVSTLWTENTGNDLFGFSVLPSGYYHVGGPFGHLHDESRIWTSSEVDSSLALYRLIVGNETYIYSGSLEKSSGYSVRCIVDCIGPYKNYTDSRDGKVYPCIQMPDGNWWFAKNFDYESSASHTHNEDLYGRLYNWQDAIDSAPSGCRLPTDADWTAIFNSKSTGDGEGTLLKASSSLWKSNSGNNLYGFSALPGGYYLESGEFSGYRTHAHFWTSTKSSIDQTYAWLRQLHDTETVLNRTNYSKNLGLSVRYIVNNFSTRTYKNYIDPRDGKIYPCVLMPDGKWWSTRNLAYDSANSFYYSDDYSNGVTFGKLYPWTDLATACPPGCHIPTQAEWVAMLDAVGDPAGTLLKANSSLWTDNTGSDAFGLALLPSGYRSSGNFLGLNSTALIWTATADRLNHNYAWAIYLDGTYTYVNQNNRLGQDALAVRFIVSDGDFDPGIDPGTDPTTGDKRLPDDGVTLTPISAPVAFTPFTKRVRKSYSLGGPVFSSTFKFTFTSDELDEVLPGFVSSPIGLLKYPSFPIGLTKLTAYIVGNRTVDPLVRGATVSLPVKVLLDELTAKYPTPTLAAGKIPACPFILRPVDGLSEAATEIIEGIVDPYSGRVFTGDRGTDLALTVEMSTDEMAQFITWWWKVLDCGRRKFVANVYDFGGCLVDLTSAPSFTLSKNQGQVKLTMSIRDLKRTITATSFTEIYKGGSQLSTTVDGDYFPSDTAGILISDDGIIVDKSEFWFSKDSDVRGWLHYMSTIPSGNYHWCVFGGGKISSWNRVKVY